METERTETALVVVDRPGSAIIRPVATPALLVEAHKEVANLIQAALERGRDYGVIPGTGTKPTLLKPGAERLAIAFGSFPRYSILDKEIDHDREVTWTKRKKVWDPKVRGKSTFEEVTGTSRGVYRYVVRCELVLRASGLVVSDHIGSCSSLESKYIDRPRDCENTVLKVAEKRAFVGACLNGFGLSDRFTADLDDREEEPEQPAPAAKRATPAASSNGDLATAPQRDRMAALVESPHLTEEQKTAGRKALASDLLTSRAAGAWIGKAKAALEAAAREEDPGEPPPEEPRREREPGEEG